MSTRTLDPVIARRAGQARAVANMHLTWHLDRLRLAVGLVEIVPREEDNSSTVYARTLRRSLRPNDPEPQSPARFLPTGGGFGVLVRDVTR